MQRRNNYDYNNNKNITRVLVLRGREKKSKVYDIVHLFLHRNEWWSFFLFQQIKKFILLLTKFFLLFFSLLDSLELHKLKKWKKKKKGEKKVKSKTKIFSNKYTLLKKSF
jgi:hypothetical protein